LVVLIALRDLVARECRSTARAVRQNLVAAIQQSLCMQRGERPPHAFDVVVRVRDVRVLVVQPVADPLAEPLPLATIREHALAAEPVELSDSELLDVRLARETQSLLDFDLDRQAVRVPTRLSLDAIALHRAVTAEQILDRSREHVMDARLAVGR